MSVPIKSSFLDCEFTNSDAVRRVAGIHPDGKLSKLRSAGFFRGKPIEPCRL